MFGDESLAGKSSRYESRGTMGGAVLRPDLSAILRHCEAAGPLFVLFRSEACILGAMAKPLWVLEQTGVHLAASGAITLNLVAGVRSAAFAYIEPGPMGGFIDAIEFCIRQRTGFLKLCRTERSDRERWLALLADFQSGPASAEQIAGIDKTNHLEIPPTAFYAHPESEAGVVLEKFLEHAAIAKAQLHVLSACPAARARLTITPKLVQRLGHWLLASAEETAFHVAPSAVRELRVVVRPHLAMLVLLGMKGQLIAKITTREAALIQSLNQIL